MEKSQVDLEYLRRIDHEHSLLARRLEKLTEALVDRKNIDALEELLTKTRDEVGMHFKLEEDGAYLYDAVSYAPQLTGQAQHLLEQHTDLLQRIEAILKAVKSNAAERLDWDEIQSRGHEFVSLLIEHERDENLLIQEAYEQEMGLPD